MIKFYVPTLTLFAGPVTISGRIRCRSFISQLHIKHKFMASTLYYVVIIYLSAMTIWLLASKI